jgi:hypothetical protein
MNGFGGITDVSTVDELERQGQITPETAAAMRQRISPELQEPATASAPQPQQWSSGAFPAVADNESTARAAWGSTAQAALGHKLQTPEVDMSGFSQAPAPGEMPKINQRPQTAAAPQTSTAAFSGVRVPSSAGAITANRRGYQKKAEESEDEIRMASQKELEGRMRAEEIGVQKAAEENAYAKEMIAQQEADNKAAMERKARFDAQMQEKQAALNADIESVRGEKIDSDTRSLGQKIGGAIAMALGAYAQAWTGGENTALKLVQKQIDDNIETQRANLANKRSSIEDKRRAITEERGQFENAEESGARMAAKGYELAKAKIDTLLASKYLDDESRAKLTEMRGQFETAQAEKLNGVMQQHAATTNAMLAQEDAAKSRQFGAQLSIAEAQAKAAKDGKEDVVEIPGGGGWVGKPLTKTAFDDAIKKAGDAEGILGQIEGIEEIVGSVGREAFPTSAAIEAKARMATLKLDFGKNILNLGVLSDSDKEDLNEILASDPTQMRQGQVQAQMRALKSLIKKSTASYMKARGFMPKDDVGFREGM